jgi:hypothetical protein
MPISLPALTTTDIRIIDRSGERELCLVARLSSPYLATAQISDVFLAARQLLGLLKIGP